MEKTKYHSRYRNGWKCGNEFNIRLFHYGESRMEDLSSHVFRHGDASLPELVAPVDAREERHEPRLVVVPLLERALLHAEGVADVVELELLAVLLPHALLDELVPVVDGEGPRRDDELVPQRLDVVVGRLLREVQAVELQSERGFKV